MKKFLLSLSALVIAIAASAQTTTTIWEGSEVFDESWGGSIVLSNDKFATVKDGDYLNIEAEPVAAVAWQWGSQVFLKTTREGWDDISSTVSVSAKSIYKVMITDKTIDLAKAGVSSTMIDELKNYGLAIQGVDAKVTKVDLVSAVATSEKELTLVEGHTILAEDFDKYPADTQVKLSFINISGESRAGWGIGGFANADNWVPSFNIAAAAGDEFDIYVTVGDMITAAKKGGAEYVPGQYHGNGITFNIYNDCKLVSAKVLVPADPTAIKATSSEAATVSAVYTIGGAKVNGLQKGLNIVSYSDGSVKKVMVK